MAASGARSRHHDEPLLLGRCDSRDGVVAIFMMPSLHGSKARSVPEYLQTPGSMRKHVPSTPSPLHMMTYFTSASTARAHKAMETNPRLN